MGEESSPRFEDGRDAAASLVVGRSLKAIRPLFCTHGIRPRRGRVSSAVRLCGAENKNF
jgi:hypothetical protein